MKHRVACIVLLAASTAALAACGLAAAGGEEEGVDEEDGAPTSTSVDSETLITLQRTECYGTCPAYSLSITGDGTVSYVGKSFVKVKGPASKQVPVSEVQGLVDQFIQADYFNMAVPEECPGGVATDAPSSITSLTLGGRTHSVMFYHGNACAPAGLHSLETAIDAVAGSAAWLHCEDTPEGACCDLENGNPFLYPCN